MEQSPSHCECGAALRDDACALNNGIFSDEAGRNPRPPISARDTTGNLHSPGLRFAPVELHRIPKKRTRNLHEKILHRVSRRASTLFCAPQSGDARSGAAYRLDRRSCARFFGVRAGGAHDHAGRGDRDGRRVQPAAHREQGARRGRAGRHRRCTPVSQPDVGHFRRTAASAQRLRHAFRDHMGCRRGAADRVCIRARFAPARGGSGPGLR